MQNYVYSMVSAEFLKRERETYTHRLSHTENNCKNACEISKTQFLLYISFTKYFHYLFKN